MCDVKVRDWRSWLTVKIFSWSYDHYSDIKVNDLKGHADEWEGHNSHQIQSLPFWTRAIKHSTLKRLKPFVSLFKNEFQFCLGSRKLEGNCALIEYTKPVRKTKYDLLIMKCHWINWLAMINFTCRHITCMNEQTLSTSTCFPFLVPLV